ncbi:MAG: EthD domain-containing protein [Xanthomonadales bacterium]
MINAVTLLWRKPGMSVDAFQRYWRHQHAEVIALLPGIQRYVQSHPIDDNYGAKEPVCDGFAELWAHDSQAFRDIAASDAYAAVQADEEKFLDRTAISLVLTDERIIKDSPVAVDGVKCIQPFIRKRDLSVEEFQSYWHDQYGPLTATLPLLDRYVQYHARLGGYTHGRQPSYDGFDVTWFDSIDAVRNAMNSAVCDRGRSAQKNFLTADDCPQILTREHVIIG